MPTDIIWLSSTDFVSGDDSLSVQYPSVTHSAVEVNANAPGDFKWISLGLKVPLFYEINAIHVCYQLSNSRSFVSQICLVEMRTPDQAVVRHDDGTELLSTAPACYRSQLAAAYRPDGAVTLQLRLNFQDVADTITFGALGVEVDARSCIPLSTYRPSTLPAPGTPGCLARVTDASQGLWMDNCRQWLQVGGERIEVAELATGGMGTQTDPWTGWEVALNALPSATNIHLQNGWYLQTTPIWLKSDQSLYGDGWGTVMKHTVNGWGDGLASVVVAPHPSDPNPQVAARHGSGDGDRCRSDLG